MSIFDKLKKTASTALNNSVKTAASSVLSTRETFTFASLPESLAELQALPEASMDTPFKTAALAVCALCVYPADKNIGIEMLNYLLGPRPLNNFQISFLVERFRDGHHVPFSYFKGASPENDYTPDTPFTITIEPVRIPMQIQARAIRSFMSRAAAQIRPVRSCSASAAATASGSFGSSSCWLASARQNPTIRGHKQPDLQHHYGNFAFLRTVRMRRTIESGDNVDRIRVADSSWNARQLCV